MELPLESGDKKTPAIQQNMLYYRRENVIYFIVILNLWFSARHIMIPLFMCAFFEKTDRSVSQRKNCCF